MTALGKRCMRLETPRSRHFVPCGISSQRVGGQVLAEQTNLALSRCSGEWVVYLQADEVLHEDDLENIHASMRRHRYDRTEGLLFNYLHSDGSYHTVGDDWREWYPRAVRAV